MTFPPFGSIPKSYISREEPYKNPCTVIHSSCRWHHPRSTNQDRHVDKPDPFLVREGLSSQPDKNRSNGTYEEEPINRPIYTFISKDPPRCNQTPYNRGIIEHCIRRTCPYTACGSAFTNVRNGLH
uniref:Uncharacterized protein n=2 Tax=Opuntia streptacantha TaxID=393608 RepID=A0A7C9D672_OPUST